VLALDLAKAVVNNFIVSRIDYCNSLLAMAPRYQLDCLQSILNVTVSLVLGAKKYNIIKHMLLDCLQWLLAHSMSSLSCAC